MYHLDNNSGVDVMPAIANKESDTTKWFTSRTPTQVASHPGADWFNIVQAELLNVLTEANITPDKTKLNQISQAIRQVVSDNAPPSASTEVAGTVKLNNTVTSTSITEAGTANAVKTAYDRGSLGVTNAAAAQTTANTTKNIFDILIGSESRVWNPSKKHFFKMRENGSAGVFDSVNGKDRWYFDADGKLAGGTVPTERITGLNNTVTSTATNQAATANAVKIAYDKGVEALNKANSASGFSQNLTQAGWCKLPNGLILQWGESSSTVANNKSSATLTATLPITCNKILSISATPMSWLGPEIGKTYSDLRDCIVPNFKNFNGVSKITFGLTPRNNYASTATISYFILCL